MSWNVGVLGSCAVSHLRAFVSARSPRSPQSLVRERPRAARVSWRGDQARAAFGLLQPVQRAGRGGLIPGWVLEAGPRGEQALAHSARSGRPGHQSSHPLLEVIGVRQVCPFANEDRLVITDALGTAAYMATAGGTRPAARCHGPLFKVCRRRLLRRSRRSPGPGFRSARWTIGSTAAAGFLRDRRQGQLSRVTIRRPAVGRLARRLPPGHRPRAPWSDPW